MKRHFLLFVILLLPNLCLAGLHTKQKLVVDKIERSYDLYVPDSPNKGPYPLVLLYHGHFGSSQVMTGENGKKAPYKIWLELAEKDKFIVAIPNGEKGSDDKRGWNDCRADSTSNPETNDVKFTQKMLRGISKRYTIDRSRIYASGTSNGGNMVLRLAMEVPQHFAAVAAVVASNPVKNECKQAKRPISVLFMNGDADPLLPFDGGWVGKKRHHRGLALSTLKSVKYWNAINQIKDKPTVYRFKDITRRDRSTVVRYSYANGKDNTEVVLYRVLNGGHTEPSRREKYRRIYKLVVGNQNYDIEMAEEVWRFFQSKRR